MPFLRRVTKKFGHAFTGLHVAISTDNSFKAHLAFTALALGLCLWLQPSLLGWALVVLGIGLVFVAELFNTAIEYLVRMFTTEYHELAEKLLDISAGAVLFASVVALVLAALVFLPLLLNLGARS
jgi:diacylglycerol kinase